MKTACGTMLQVQVPFPVEDVHDFWANHTTEETGETGIWEHMYGLGKDFGKLIRDEVPTIRVKYMDQEKVMLEPEYRHWYACYYTLTNLNMKWIGEITPKEV